MRLRSIWLIFLLIILGIILIWSGIHPLKRIIWAYEVAPGILLILCLWLTYDRFPLTPLSYGTIFIGTIFMFIGGHYTYAEVPLFDTFKQMFNLARNHFDRLGHLLFGMIIATLSRELMVRQHWFPQQRWISLAFILLTLAISSGYELFEFIVGMLSGAEIQEFLGAQGDMWDSHWDIICAVIGALIIWLLGRWQDRQIDRLDREFH